MNLFAWIHPYGLLIGIGVAAGILLIERISKWFGKDTRWLDQSLLWIIAGAVIGARAYHLATDWQLYIHASLLDLIAVWRGGLGFIGAVLGGFLGLLLWMRRTGKLNLFTLFTYLDLLSFGVPLAQIIGRLGNYYNQELYGQPTDLPWGIMIKGQRYHPLFLYESLANLMLLGLLVWLAKKKAFVLGKGQYASLYLFGYTFIRFWLEYLRIETARWDGIGGIFSIAQWVCLIGMVLAAILFWVRRHAPKKNWDFSLE